MQVACWMVPDDFVKGFQTVSPFATGKPWESRRLVNQKLAATLHVVNIMNDLTLIHVTNRSGCLAKEGHRCLSWSGWTDVMELRKPWFPSSSRDAVFPSQYDRTLTSWGPCPGVLSFWRSVSSWVRWRSCFWVGAVPLVRCLRCFWSQVAAALTLVTLPTCAVREGLGLELSPIPIMRDKSQRQSALSWGFLMPQTWILCCRTLERRPLVMGGEEEGCEPSSVEFQSWNEFCE